MSRIFLLNCKKEIFPNVGLRCGSDIMINDVDWHCPWRRRGAQHGRVWPRPDDVKRVLFACPCRVASLQRTLTVTPHALSTFFILITRSVTYAIEIRRDFFWLSPLVNVISTWITLSDVYICFMIKTTTTLSRVYI